jgi:hypothetical protein
LIFPMQSNLVLHATFVPNPFIPAKGDYYGLFYNTNDVRHESSGFIRLTLTDRGTFTGDLQSAGHRYPVRSQFDLAGHAMASVPRPGDSLLSMELSLNPEGPADQIHGTVTDGNWITTLLADRAVFNATTHVAPYAGQFTLAIPAEPDRTEVPPGDGFGALRVSTGGSVQFSGTLADGTKINEAAPVSRMGVWPFYVSLYGGKGCILGRLTFGNEVADDLGGLVHWIRPALAGTGIYLAGFTNASFAIGSKYGPPVPMTRLMNITNGVVEFSVEDADPAFTNAVVLGQDNKLANLSSNRMALTISVPTGIWRGTATEPSSGRTLTLQGVLLQRQNVGLGFFAATNQTGRVVLRAL